MPATADPRTTPSIAVHWVKNNILSAIVSGGVSLAVLGVRQATGGVDADAGLVVAAIHSVAVIIFWAFAGIANGVLTGVVLQRIVPLLPVWTWIALQAAMAVILGVGSEANRAISPGPATSADELSMGATLLLGFIAGAIIGGVIGGLEALVLRRAAFGTGSWIAWSAAAYAIAWSWVSARIGRRSVRVAGGGDHVVGDAAGAAAPEKSIAVDGRSAFHVSPNVGWGRCACANTCWPQDRSHRGADRRRAAADRGSGRYRARVFLERVRAA